MDDFLENLYGFPKMVHDDDVDAFTQLIIYIVGKPGALNITPELLARLSR